MSTDRPINRWELLIAYLVDRGFSRDEIADEFDHHAVEKSFRMATVTGEWLDWSTLYGRRRVEPLIAAACGEPMAIRVPGNLTTDAIIRAAWASGELNSGRPSQEETALALHTSLATLKRARARLRIGWPPPPPEDFDPR